MPKWYDKLQQVLRSEWSTGQRYSALPLGESRIPNATFEKLRGLLLRQGTSFSQDIEDIFSELALMYTGAPNTAPLEVLSAALGNNSPDIRFLRLAEGLGFLAEWRLVDWKQLKATYGYSMALPQAEGVSWEHLRHVAVRSVQGLVDAFLVDSGMVLSPEWLQVGTVGYQSDIDASLEYYERGTSFAGDTMTEFVAKILFDICWFSIFGGLSGKQADTEVYTSIKTYEEPDSWHAQFTRDATDIQLALIQLRNVAPQAAASLYAYSKQGGNLQKMLDEADSFISANKQIVDEEMLRLQDSEEEELRRMATVKVQLPILFHLAEEQDIREEKIGQIELHLEQVPIVSPERRQLLAEKDMLATEHLFCGGLMATYFDESYFANASFRSVVVGGQKVRADAKIYHAGPRSELPSIAPPDMTSSARRAALVENYAMWEQTVFQAGNPFTLLVDASKYAQRVINEALFLQQELPVKVNEPTRQLLQEVMRLSDVSHISPEHRRLAEEAQKTLPLCSTLHSVLSRLIKARTASDLDRQTMLLRQVVRDADDGFSLPLEFYDFRTTIAVLEGAKRRMRVPTYELAMRRFCSMLEQTGLQLSTETMAAFRGEFMQRYQRLRTQYDFHHIVEVESVPNAALLGLYMEWIRKDNPQRYDAAVHDPIVTTTLGEILGSRNVDLFPDELSILHKEIYFKPLQGADELRGVIRAYFARIALESLEQLEVQLSDLSPSVRQMLDVPACQCCLVCRASFAGCMVASSFFPACYFP